MSEENKSPKDIQRSEEWERAREVFVAAIEHERQLSETFWNNLSSEEQLWAFCAIMRRINDSYLSENGTPSYRHFLYDVMGWGPEAYSSAQCSGFLDIHNSIFNIDDLTNAVINTNKQLGIESDPEAVRDIIIKRLFY